MILTNPYRSLKKWYKLLVELQSNAKRFEMLERNVENLIKPHYLQQSDQNTVNFNDNYKHFIKTFEFRIHSQNGEDGLLMYIFSQIGTTNKKFIEFGMGHGRECNSANLIINFGWSGLMMDGNAEKIGLARKFYGGIEHVDSEALSIQNEWVTRENINELFEKHGVTGEIDLLSLDIDGNDYWIWEAINVINPRVVVIEYNAAFGDERSVSVGYDEAFDRFEKHKSGWYHGASITAMSKLAERKKYKLVCCDYDGVDAFFVREDVLDGMLKPMSAREAFYPQRSRLAKADTKGQFKTIEHLELIEV